MARVVSQEKPHPYEATAGRGGASDWLVLVLLLGLVAFLRLPAFQMAVVDWDESIYLLMADSWLDGHPPYTVVWDHKPPGIYLIFALAEVLFGRSVLAVRLAAWLSVSASSFLLYLFGTRRIGPERTRPGRAVGLLAALLYAVFTLNNGGFAANTEIFFAPFVILGFYLLWPLVVGRQPVRSAGAGLLLAAGLSFGLGLQIKFAVALDLGAALLLLLLAARPDLSTMLRSGSLFALGTLMPLAIAALAFAAAGNLPEYVDANFIANLRYGEAAQFSLPGLVRTLAAQLRQNALLWIGALLAPLYLLSAGRHDPARRDLGLLGVWLAVDLVGILATREPYWHYFLQLLPPLCLVVAITAIGTLRWSRRQSIPWASIAVGALLVVGLLQPLRQPIGQSALALRLWLQGERRVDVPTYVADYIEDRIAPGDLIYVADYEPIVYFLADAPAPTRYLLPSWLTQERFARFVGVDPMQELDAIMAQRPVYVLVRAGQDGNSPFIRRLHRLLADQYHLETTIRQVDLFRRSR